MDQNLLAGFVSHELANGEKVIITSPHGFKFSDGTEAETGASREAADLITVERQQVQVRDRVSKSTLSLSEESLAVLAELNQQADWVVVPFMVSSALDQMGLRDDERFVNVVAFNATEETRRSRPADKVIDINNWAY